MLRNYIYIDQTKLDQFAEQVRTRKKQTLKQQKKVIFSITKLGVEFSEETGWEKLSNHEKIEGLVEYLRKNNLLSTARPMEQSESE